MKIRFPAIFLNFKTYKESSGKNGIFLAKIADKISREYQINIIIAPQHPLLAKIVEEVGIPVIAQSVNHWESGSHTGWISPENLKDLGVQGTLINHSEHNETITNIERIIHLCKKENLFTLSCANNDITSVAVASCRPDAIAMEPPELIGSGISVSTRPEIVDKTITGVKKYFPEVKVIVGAGVSSGRDVRDAIKLGAEGILLASAFVKSKDPESTLAEMVKALVL